MKLKYCIKCLMPTTKLHLNFTNGVCNTCVYYKSYKNSKKMD